MGKEHEKARARFSAAQIITEAEGLKSDVKKAEDVYGQVQALLGQEGTYPGSPGYTGPTIMGGGPSAMQTSGEVAKGAVSQIKGTKERARLSAPGSALAEQAAGIDVQKTVQQIAGSKGFQIASQLTAEAQQLINREGPMYERMQMSLNNPILKRGSQMMEDSIEELKSSYASGGRARREGLKDAMKMQAQMEANEFVGSQMVQANAAMDQWARQNAQAVLAFNQAWAGNAQGVRQSYLQAMSAARGFMLQAAIPAARAMQQQADAINQQGKKNWVDIGIGAVMTVVGAVVTAFGGGAVGVPMMAAGISKASSGTSAGDQKAAGMMAQSTATLGGIFGGGGQTFGGGGGGSAMGTATKAGGA